MIENPAPGIQIERCYQRQMIIFTLTARFTAATLDTWMAVLSQYVQERQSTSRYIVYDLSQSPNLMFTSGVSQRLKEIGRLYPDATGRVVAIVPQVGVFQPIAEFFLQQNNVRAQPNLEIRLFNNRQEGIAWVSEPLTAG
ncbi:MAG TPA: hypothetical protein VHO69_09755 [Phototrophicaceae bacterium]|nr:hypothetical protein [Phototrophicaceae bacterium]